MNVAQLFGSEIPKFLIDVVSIELVFHAFEKTIEAHHHEQRYFPRAHERIANPGLRILMCSGSRSRYVRGVVFAFVLLGLGFLLNLLVRKLRLKTSAAASLIHSARAHYDQLF